MRYLILVVMTLGMVIWNGCSNEKSKINSFTFTPVAFEGKIRELPTALIIDVRTPDEFASGHIANATNYDWDNPSFSEKIATLDKSKPVLVYCLSGSRSSSAAQSMRAKGFEQVHELSGGITAWRAEGLPEVR